MISAAAQAGDGQGRATGEDSVAQLRRKHVALERTADRGRQVQGGEHRLTAIAHLRIRVGKGDSAIESGKAGAQQVETDPRRLARFPNRPLRQALGEDGAQLQAGAVNARLDRRLLQTEDGGDLAQPELGDIRQQQRHPKGLRQRRDPPLHQFAGLGAQAVAVRAGRHRPEVRNGRSGLRQELVERLEVPRLAGPPPPPAEAGSMGDGEEPGPRVLRILELTDRPKGVEKSVLDEVVGIPVAADPARQRMNPSRLRPRTATPPSPARNRSPSAPS